MDVIYKVTYLPHLGTRYPKFYIGSKKNYDKRPNYMGSPDSRKVFPYTEGLTLSEWWKLKTKTESENFKFEILEQYDDMDKYSLIEREKNIHEDMNVLSEEYFNRSIATLGWVSVLKDEDTRNKMSESARKYWSTADAKKRKLELIERNRTLHSKVMKEKWKNPTEAMKNKIATGRPKGVKEKRPRKVSMRKVIIENTVFDNAFEAAKVYGIDPVNVRRRCRQEQYTDWNYIKETK